MWHDKRASCQGFYLSTYHSFLFFSPFSSLLPTRQKLFSFLFCINKQKTQRKIKCLDKEIIELFFPILKFSMLVQYKINNRFLNSAAFCKWSEEVNRFPVMAKACYSPKICLQYSPILGQDCFSTVKLSLAFCSLRWHRGTGVVVAPLCRSFLKLLSVPASGIHRLDVL